MTSAISPSQFVLEKFGGSFEGYIGLFVKQTKRTRFFAENELDQLDNLVPTLAPTKDLYLTLGTQKDRLPPRKRGKANTVRMVPGFLADIDFASAKNSPKNYPLDEAAVLDVLREFDWWPTTLVRTGGGLHAHWDWERPLRLYSAEDTQTAGAVWRRFQRGLQQHFAERGYHIDSVGDLARLYRIPGTFNHKTTPPKHVEVIHHG
jgi:hypothetical protein